LHYQSRRRIAIPRRARGTRSGAPLFLDQSRAEKEITMRKLVAPLLLLGMLAGAASLAVADPGKEEPAVREDPMYTEGVKAVNRGDYAAAIRLFEAIVARDDRNADAYNMLGYSTRKAGDAQRAVPIYQKALAIDPKHRGAHEYIGEAYLMLGDLAKAKEHLAALDKLCLLPCSEYSDLKKAVQAFETSGGRVRPTSHPSR
jgi:tetratricopeptide (TPR) repeat protein